MAYSSQQFASSFLSYLDNDIWNKVALKVIEKIPRIVNTKEIEGNLQDFVLMNSQPSLTSPSKNQTDRQVEGKISEKMLSGCSNIIRREHRSLTGTSSKPPSSLSRNRIKKLTSRVLTSGADQKYIQNSQITNGNSNTHQLLFFQQNGNQDTRMQDYFRASKTQQQKFDLKQIQDSLERNIASQERLNAQKRKFKDAKHFTYDYEGKILGMAPKKSENVKVFNIKSFFKSNNQKQKQKIANKMNSKLDPDKIVSVQTKKVVSMDHYRREESIGELDVNRLGKTTPVNLIKMFKGDHSVQMGVSFTDLIEKSTINGPVRNNEANNNMKLSQFKEKNSSNFKDGKTRAKTQEKKQKKSRIDMTRQSPQPTIGQKFLELRSNSDASSRILSSSFSHFKKGMGRITKNEKLYSATFEK